jgi:transcriptional regulator with XRE-family HTH domain
MELTKKALSKNIAELIDATGLSDEDFALLCEVSRATISNIKNGKTTGTIKTLNKIVGFTQIAIDKLTKPGFIPPIDLRERLQKKYKNDITKSVILNKTPSVPYVVKFRVFQTSFLNEYRERKELITFIKDTYGWEVNPNTLTTNLKRMEKVLDIKEHPNKKIGYVYRKKY